MSQFTRDVSRKVLGVVTVFALAAVAVVAIVAGSGGPDTVGLTGSRAGDAQALGVALDDPASTDASPAPGDGSAGWSQLRSDLKAARALDGDARRSALDAIRQKARDGGYGDRVERRADRREVRHDLFFSLLPDNLQADLTQLKAAPDDQRKQLRETIMDKAVAGDYGSDFQKAAERLKALRQD
ncbi:MAG TPA: hypothetical protein VFE07_09725 [Marmoricola sp.]|nr:hypothetical protein [Marmoricola sp.]